MVFRRSTQNNKELTHRDHQDNHEAQRNQLSLIQQRKAISLLTKLQPQQSAQIDVTLE